MPRNVTSMSFDYGRAFDDFRQFVDNSIFDEELAKAEEDITNKLLRSAKEDHRYKHRTHTLRNATKVGGHIKDKEYGLRLYVDNGVCDYGKYVIKGHGTWEPDTFIDKAIIDNRLYVKARLQEAINDTIRRMNNSKKE